MIVLVLTAIGVATALFTRERVRRLATLHVEGLWLVWAAFVSQVLLFEVVGYYIPVVATNVLHLVTYALCAAFLYRNRHLPGSWIIAAGAASNLAAIVANGGTMPANADAWVKAGLPEPTAFENSSFATDANLAMLGDIFYIPAKWPLSNVFSVGDVLIVIGGTYLAHRWCAAPTSVSDVGQMPASADSGASDDGHSASEADTIDIVVFDPLPPDPAVLARAVDDLRNRMLPMLDAAVSEAESARRDATIARGEARSDIDQTRQTLVDLLGQIEADREQRVFERAQVDGPRCAARHHDRGVAGRCVGVDADAVEGSVDDPPEDCVECVADDSDVGEHDRDHRRHVGLEHADPLGDSDDRAASHLGRGDLEHGVGGHDSRSGGFGVDEGEHVGQGGDAGANPVHGVRATDHTGRCDQHVAWFAAEPAGDSGDDVTSVSISGGPIGHVRVLRDHDDRSSGVVAEVFSADRHARPDETALREDTCRRDGVICGKDHEVVGVVLDADVRHVGPEAGWKRSHRRLIRRRARFGSS